MDARRRPIQFRRKHISARRERPASAVPRLCRLPPIPPFRSMARACCSPASRRAQDHWQIWEVALDADAWRRAAARYVVRRRLRSSLLPAGRPRRICEEERRPFRDRGRRPGVGQDPPANLWSRKLPAHRCSARRPHFVRSDLPARNQGHAGTLYRLFGW